MHGLSLLLELSIAVSRARYTTMWLQDLLTVANSAAMMTLGVAWAALTKGLLAHRDDPKTAHWLLDAALGNFLKGTTVKQKQRLFGLMDGPALSQARSLHPAVKITQDIDGTWFKSLPADDNTHPDVIILHMHGGGFTTGTPSQSAPALALLVDGVRSQGLCCWLLALDYGLAPEHPFPHALAQVLTRLQAVQEQWSGLGDGAPAIMLSGDSAGGNLVATTLLALHQVVPHLLPHTLPHPPLAGALLLSPWVDLTQQAYSFAPAPPATSTSWLVQLTNHIAALAGAPKLQGLNGSCMSTQPCHIHPCPRASVPADGCACQAQHRFRIDNDFVSLTFLLSCMEMYVSGTISHITDSSGSSDESVHGVVLKHVKGSATDLHSMLAHPLVSPIKADPKVFVEAVNKLLCYPALIMAGEYEVLLPDILKWADGVNEASTSMRPAVQPAAGQQSTGDINGAEATSSPLIVELWPKEIHEAALLPMRQNLVPRLSQYVVNATRAWQGHARK